MSEILVHEAEPLPMLLNSLTNSIIKLQSSYCKTRAFFNIKKIIISKANYHLSPVDKNTYNNLSIKFRMVRWLTTETSLLSVPGHPSHLETAANSCLLTLHEANTQPQTKEYSKDILFS